MHSKPSLSASFPNSISFLIGRSPPRPIPMRSNPTNLANAQLGRDYLVKSKGDVNHVLRVDRKSYIATIACSLSWSDAWMYCGSDAIFRP